MFSLYVLLRYRFVLFMPLVLNVPFVRAVSYRLHIFHIITSFTTFASFAFFPNINKNNIPLPPITKTIQVRQIRHCWRSRDDPISDVLLWAPTYGRAKAGRPARTYTQQLCEDTGCSPEYLPEAMNDWEKWRERVRDIRAGGATWWWWWNINQKQHKFWGDQTYIPK